MWRKLILMGFNLGIVLIFAVFFGCGSQKNTEQPVKSSALAMPKEPHDVQFVFHDMVPICGGYHPGPDVPNPRPEVIIDETWTVYSVNEDGSRNRPVGRLTSDENGTANYRLQKGTYQLFISAKEQPFSEFVKSNTPDRGKYYTYGDEACFRRWYESPDFVIEIQSDTTLELNYRNNCFTNRHPCLNYDGPYPP